MSGPPWIDGISSSSGAMTGGGYPDGIREIMDAWTRGDRAATRAAYAKWLPLINHENRQCGLAAAKALMKEGGIIRSEALRHPLPPLNAHARQQLIELGRELDVMALRWGR